MVDKNDWRRQGQEKHLCGVELYFIEFKPFSEQWEHEHCCFCWDKFSSNDNNLKFGYCTTPQNEKTSNWICPNCFNDFKDEFGWTVHK